jgi:hypothetical protein
MELIGSNKNNWPETSTLKMLMLNNQEILHLGSLDSAIN